MSLDLGYDLEEALQRRSNRISKKSIEALRTTLADSKQVPQTITDKLVKCYFHFEII